MGVVRMPKNILLKKVKNACFEFNPLEVLDTLFKQNVKIILNLIQRKSPLFAPRIPMDIYRYMLDLMNKLT